MGFQGINLALGGALGHCPEQLGTCAGGFSDKDTSAQTTRG